MHTNEPVIVHIRDKHLSRLSTPAILPPALLPHAIFAPALLSPALLKPAPLAPALPSGPPVPFRLTQV